MKALSGLGLAFSWLTVVPVSGPAKVDRVAATWAIALAPVTGVFVGVVAAAALWLSLWAGFGAPLAGVLAVAAQVLLTRGMHVDGLSDTADGLGSYAGPQRAQEIMHSGGAGPFGVAAVVFSVVGQALVLGELAEHGRWLAVVVVAAAARVAVVLACREGTLAARPQGFGVLVAGTQRRSVVVLWSLALVGAATLALPHRPWQGPLVVAVALALSVVVGRHCRRRLGGVSGDVLGAMIEVTALVTALGLAAGS